MDDSSKRTLSTLHHMMPFPTVHHHVRQLHRQEEGSHLLGNKEKQRRCSRPAHSTRDPTQTPRLNNPIDILEQLVEIAPFTSSSGTLSISEIDPFSVGGASLRRLCLATRPLIPRTADLLATARVIARRANIAFRSPRARASKTRDSGGGGDTAQDR